MIILVCDEILNFFCFVMLKGICGKYKIMGVDLERCIIVILFEWFINMR